MMWWNNGMNWADWLVMALSVVVFWALVVAAIVAIFRGTGDQRSLPASAERDPQHILDERFARGEIDADEYHARQDVLRAAH